MPPRSSSFVARSRSLRRVPTMSLDEAKKVITWKTYIGYVSRFIMPGVVWAVISRIIPRRDMGVTDAGRIELLAFTNNYLAAIGLLYAIYLGITFQTAFDRLKELRAAIAREGSGLHSVCELSITLSGPTPTQRAQLQGVLQGYVDHVLSRELHTGVTDVNLSNESAHSVVSELYSLFAIFKELASNGVNDSVDLRTLDALHDEVRGLVCARSERIALTNQSVPMSHWLVLMFLSIFTVLGVAVNDIPSAPVVTTSLSGVIGMVIPLSFLIVTDMNAPFTGMWSVSDAPLRGVRKHILPRLTQAASFKASSTSAVAIAVGSAETSEQTDEARRILERSKKGAPAAV